AVRKIDTDQGWAIIEPGVTQGELSELLIGTQKMLNITASSAHSSFLGNALDRGVGLRHQRTEDLVGIEVLLPTGKIIRVGWWPGSVETPIYP
ncbi:FAD-binding protein, partial [Escherichia coli]